MEKETLEEAAKNYAIDNSLIGYESMPYKGFINGAKWQAEKNELRLKHKKALLDNCEKCLEMRIKQAERMYSEEDLREAFKQSRQCKIFEKDMPPVYNEFEDWFQEFKKK